MDYIFLKIFHFVLLIKKDRIGAKWSALLYTSLYATCLTTLFFSLTGLTYENLLSSILKKNTMAFSMTISVIWPILLSLRYYKYRSIESIEKSFTEKSKLTQKTIEWLIYVFLVFIPILCYMYFRLYVIGKI
jgi:hypothetical protein